jgi:hypothetical protein
MMTTERPVWLPDRQPCADQHTPTPPGYEEFFMWAEWKARTHDQTCCPDCGLWAIWVPKKAED